MENREVQRGAAGGRAAGGPGGRAEGARGPRALAYMQCDDTRPGAMHSKYIVAH